MIYTLKIKLLGGLFAENEWEGIIEISKNATLESLHNAIQSAVNFDNDHLYEFYISRTERSKDKIRFDDENEKIYTEKVGDLFPLVKDRRLFYMFDYGDSWVFQISKDRKTEFLPLTGVKYPRLAKEKGSKPQQYPDAEW